MGKTVDFQAAIQAAHGHITPKKGADGKCYYIKNNVVLATYDDVVNKGFLYK